MSRILIGFLLVAYAALAYVAAFFALHFFSIDLPDLSHWSILPAMLILHPFAVGFLGGVLLVLGFRARAARAAGIRENPPPRVIPATEATLCKLGGEIFGPYGRPYHEPMAALVASGEETIFHELMALVGHPQVGTRILAAYGLGLTRNPEALAALQTLYSGPEPSELRFSVLNESDDVVLPRHQLAEEKRIRDWAIAQCGGDQA